MAPPLEGAKEKGQREVRNVNKKQANKGSIVIWVIVLLVILIYNFAGDLAGDFEPNVLLPIGIAFIAFVVAIIITAFKTKAGKTEGKKQTAVALHRPFPQPTAVKAKQASPLFRHKDDAEAEEAVTCAHRTGKEKYLEQVEGFYRNGLIDRAEYKVLREKYERLDLPEDYH